MGRGLVWRIVLPFSLLFAALTGASGWYAARRAAASSERRLLRRMEQVAQDLARLPLNRRQELLRIKGVVDLELAALDVTGQVNHTLDPALLPKLQALLAGPTGQGGVRLGGRSWRYVRRRVEGPFLVALLVLVPEERIGEARREAAQGILGGAAVAVVLAALLGLLLARGLTRPIAELADETRRIAAGELDRRIEPSGPRELQALACSFNRMVESLARSRAELVEAEKRALLGRMATAVAHEIRNPLTPIRITVQLLAEQERLDPEARADLQVVLGEIDRLEHVVGELLTLGRPGAPELVPVDLRGPVGEILRLIEGRFAHRRIELVRELPDEPLVARADRDRIKQALMNLLLNALDAAPAGSRVVVRLAREGEWACLSVEDRGPGVAEPERLFTPFYTTKPEGTGIGLVLCRTIAGEHGGEVVHEPTEQGARFVLRIPASV